MDHNRLDQHEVPHDPELAEAFEAFIQHTHVPLGFHARVMARVQQRRARRERFGWWERFWAWWTPGGAPLWVCGATVCGLLLLALSIGLGHFIWTQWKPVPTAMTPGSLTRPTVTSDTSPPLTTALVSPSPNANGWNGTDVTIGLTAVDDVGGTGVKQLQLSLVGASHGTQVVHESSTTVTISAEGATTLTYMATDNAENQEAPKTLTVQVDKTPPIITVAADPATLWPPDGTRVPVTISGTITDAGSGVNASTATYAVTDEDGSVSQTGSITVGSTGSYAFTIPLQALRHGDDLNSRQYTVTVWARDNVGNSGSPHVNVSSPAATASIIPPGSGDNTAVGGHSGIPSQTTPVQLPRPQRFGIDVRSGPGVTYEVMTKVPSGGSYVVVAQERDWYKIQLSDGREGWIHRFYTVPHEPAAQTPPVVVSARGLPSHTTLPTAFDLPSSAQSPAFTPSRPAETGTAPPMARRTALVIGNGAYPAGPLQNAVKDATDITAMLRRLSFEVTLLRNAPLQEMEEAVKAFNLRLREGGMGLFYFAGHGVQVDGENYLLPINARVARQQDVRYQALPMGRVMGAMEEAGNGPNILILDACRNTPFSRSWRSSQAGLAPTTARGMLIAYATAPGGMAADGAGGENGVYTKYLLQAMMVPGLSLEQVFKQVRSGVVAETGGKQTPWESSSLRGDFAFMPAQSDVVPAGVPPYPSAASDPETVLWSMSERSSHPEDVQAFLQAYPESRFAPAARLRLQQLQQQSATASNVPSAPLPGQATPPAVVAQDRVRAQVGIQVRSGARTAPAKTNETVKAGDSLRIYVVPEHDAYIYVVQNDGQTLTLLNAQNASTKVPQGVPVMLPAPEKFYQIDGENDRESITVICSPTEIREVASLFSNPKVTQQNWPSLEKALLDKSKIDLSQPPDKPFPIAGNVRSMSHNDPFLNTLAIYSGKSLVVKKYDFQVQK